MNPKNNPCPRQEHGLASIGNKKALLFGGYYGDTKNDTWIFTLDSFKTDVETNPINHKNKPYVYVKNKIATIEHNFFNNFKIKIANLIGQIVYSNEFSNDGFINQDIKISLENEQSGVYLLQINAGSEVCTHKLLIN